LEWWSDRVGEKKKRENRKRKRFYFSFFILPFSFFVLPFPSLPNTPTLLTPYVSPYA
jgi:hypothetical protein